MTNPDLHLWRSVLIVGLREAAQGLDPDWPGSPDFVAVCHLAQLDPPAVMHAYRLKRFGRFRQVA